ncbi:FecCD family ABC transporter permease [Lactovum miscens]|uniref:Iron complex transport system permease protein n=1 Tax=Lactovum miscens TaxID=190387 RepID=A0A841C4J0_9LACT|nr:iron ABC transporter permease [Lactovum miscens]MBB5887167.1 iron complex transport system permease protein [Lactovum miscens]
MKKRFVILIFVLFFLAVIDLTQFSSDRQILSILIPSFRLPRLLVVLAAGAALSMAGFIIQAVTDNPLADSATLGISSGASAGALGFLLFSTQLKLSTFWIFSYPIFALLGGILAFVLLYAFALRKNASSLRVLLTGVAITAFFQALISLAQLSVNSFDFQNVVVWLSGDVWQTDLTYLWLCLLLLMIAFIILPFFQKKIEILSLGEEMAMSLGLQVNKTKLQLYGLALFFSVIAVLLVGGLAFIGLIAPHIARELVGFKSRRRIPATLLSGMIILVFSDILSQIMLAPSSLPLGIVVAFIGAPYYIYLIQKV